MNTHETYVSLETAKLLKQAGFDWEVNHLFHLERFSELESPYRNHNSGLDAFGHDNGGQYMSAPTLDVAQRWLREVKRINVEVMYLFEPCNHYFARACYLDTNTPLCIPNPPASTIFEEAQEAGIKKALEIILEKNE